MLNRIILVGRVDQKYGLTYNKGGIPRVEFPLTFEKLEKPADDNEYIVSFIDVKLVRQPAVFFDKYVKQLALVMVEGRLQVKRYTRRDGGKGIYYSIIGSNIEIIDNVGPWEHLRKTDTGRQYDYDDVDPFADEPGGGNPG